ncbi:butyrophilin subfamily 1 member A1-like isoform X2 [Oreochromis aureus]|uniref:CCHC-type domain-containing protein n=1 Tax=Oreochromis aureus TaxID=47969 RepID=A0AAZ1XIP3_OREAU|nr:butyrophilin subfamily 1 member A1-like isoform X2 [Oreochromis aureus]
MTAKVETLTKVVESLTASQAREPTCQCANPKQKPRQTAKQYGCPKCIESGATSCTHCFICGETGHRALGCLKRSQPRSSSWPPADIHTPITSGQPDPKSPGSVSSPVIELTNVKNEMVLDSKSNGWYPEPQMLWVDSEGKPVSVEPTNNVRGSDGLYSLSSKVTVEKGQSYSFTCKVQQKNISQIKEAHIHVSGDLFMVQSNTAVQIIVNLAVCLISVGTAVIPIWKCGLLGLNSDPAVSRTCSRERKTRQQRSIIYLHKGGLVCILAHHE